MIAYFNGEFVAEEDVHISPFDRGFQFADSVYEVIRAYGGRYFRISSHMTRLRHSLGALRIDTSIPEVFPGIAESLLERNALSKSDAKCYLQVTRGVAPRSHRFPDPPSRPTIFASVRYLHVPDSHPGSRVVLTPDTRWARCDIKSTMLLSNVLASQIACDAGADEALFVVDGYVTEGSRSGFAAVRNGEFLTHPATDAILPSITRQVALELCDELGIAVRYEAVPVADLESCDELMILGTTAEISAITEVDGRPVTGPGPVTRRLQEAFAQKVADEVQI